MDLYEALNENFLFNKEQDITVDTYIGGTPEWTSIGTLTRSVSANEVWMIGITLAWNYDVTNKSSHLRYTIDGGTTWYQSQEEAKDKLDTRHISYAFPVQFASDDTIDFQVEVTKEDDTHVMLIEFADLTLERKG